MSDTTESTLPQEQPGAIAALAAVPGANSIDFQALVFDLCTTFVLSEGPLKDAVAKGDPESILALVRPQYAVLGLDLNEGLVRAGLSYLPNKVLADHRVAGIVAKVTRLTLTRKQWWPRYKLVIAAGAVALLVVTVVVPTVKKLRYRHWADTVSATAQSAQEARTDLEMVSNQANSLATDVAGARVHANAAIQSVGEASAVLSGVHLWSTSDTDLRQIYASATSSPDQMVQADQSILDKATQIVQNARNQIKLGQEVQAYAQEWRDLGLPTDLPPALVSAWQHDAAAMTSALASGDLNAIAKADTTLKLLQKAGQDQATANQLIGSLPDKAKPVAMQMLTQFDALLAAGNARGAAGVLDSLRVMNAQVPLAYNLSVSLGDNTSGVVRQSEANPSNVLHYLLVHASDANGNPVDVPVRDSETGQVKSVSEYGVEVSEDVYNRAKNAKENGQTYVSIGRKTAGDVNPNYVVPIGDSTITQW